MTPEELTKHLDQLSREVSNNIGAIMVKLGLDALSAIKTRVVEKGEDAEGVGFPEYSTKPMLVGCKSFKTNNCASFFGKKKNKEHRWATLDRTYKEGPKAGKKIRLAYLERGYKELREMELGTEYGTRVNFNFSGKMWGDIHIISKRSDHDNGVVMIGALKDEENAKLYYNTKRNERKGGKDILDLSDSEIKGLKEIYLNQFMIILRNNGFR